MESIMKPNTRFSIIVAVRNGARLLERLLDSLEGQTYGEWEALVQDGGSTDGTLDILTRRRDERIKVVSGPDGGVYDAWNKALDRASGAWIQFLGADDALPDPYVLARAARALAELPDSATFAQGGLALGRGGKPREILARSRAEVFRFFVSGMPLLTPACFFRKTLFAGPGERFNADYRIAGDFAFVAARLRPNNLALLPFGTAYMEAGGLSSAVRTRPLLDAERKRALTEIVLPRAADIVRACIETYGDTANPLNRRV